MRLEDEGCVLRNAMNTFHKFHETLKSGFRRSELFTFSIRKNIERNFEARKYVECIMFGVFLLTQISFPEFQLK